MNILLISNRNMHADMLYSGLTSYGFNVAGVTTLEAGFALLHAAPRPDVIIVDMNREFDPVDDFIYALLHTPGLDEIGVITLGHGSHTQGRMLNLPRRITVDVVIEAIKGLMAA